ncbi:MAG: hypothetical protein ABSA83_02715 [Verrucomicrobiota bacterium]|jgi:hypothetical protein
MVVFKLSLASHVVEITEMVNQPEIPESSNGRQNWGAKRYHPFAEHFERILEMLDIYSGAFTHFALDNTHNA